MMIKRQYNEGGYSITEYNNGTIVREVISIPLKELPISTPQPTEVEILRERVEEYNKSIIELTALLKTLNIPSN